MGWGIIGGAAVKQYNEQAKNSREMEWDDLKRQEYVRQLEMQKAIDAAANGDGDQSAPAQGVPMAPTDSAAPAPAAPAVQGGGLRMPSGPAPVDASLDGAPNAQQVPSPVAAPAAPAGTPAPTQAAAPKPKMSDQYFQRAKALMGARGGVEGMKLAMSAYQTGTQMAQQERDQELVGILQQKVPPAQKAQQLLSYINGTDVVPGDVSLEQRKDGIYMIHSAPGKEQPFALKLDGRNQEEVIGNLALKARAMYDSGLAMKLMDAGLNRDQLTEVMRHNKTTEDNTAQRNADQAEYHSGLLDIKGQMIEARAQAAGLKNALMENKHDYVPYGVDDKGMPIFYDRKQGTVMGAQLPPGVKAFPKVTGEKAAGGAGKLPATLTDAEKIKLPLALQELPADPTPDQKLKVARKYNINPEHLGASPLPSPAALGVPPKTAPAGRGLQTPAVQPGYRLSQDPQIQQYRAAIAQTPQNDVQNRMRLGTMLNNRIAQIQSEQDGYGTKVVNDLQ